MTILMNLIAFLLLVAVVGMIAAIAVILQSAREGAQLARRMLKAIARPVNSANKIYDTGEMRANAAMNRIERVQIRAARAGHHCAGVAHRVGIALSEAENACDNAVKTVEDSLIHAQTATKSIEFAIKLAQAFRGIKS